MLTLFLLVLIFIFISDLFVNTSDIINSHICMTGLTSDIYINNVRGAYNNIDDTYYFSYNQNKDRNVSKISVFSPLNYKYKIVDNKILDFKDSQMLLYNDEYFQIVNIKFVDIPIISIYSSSNLPLINKNSNYSNVFLDKKNEMKEDNQNKQAVFIVNDNNFNSMNNSYSYSVLGSFHLRGASSFNFEKKSYKLNIDSNTNILGLPYGKDYVLDSLYSDSSKIRNMLSSDLWNLINDNQNIQNDLYTTFVEVYIDNEYKGLYVLKNSVSENMFTFNNDGYLLKPYTDSSNLFIENLLKDNYNLIDNTFLNYEFKFSENYNLSLIQFVEKYKKYVKDISYDNVSEIFNIDNYINYELLLNLIMGVDNVKKNFYISSNGGNDKLYITPWDMDLTFGNNWDSNNFNGESFDLYSYSNIQWLIETNSWLNDYFFQVLKNRYWELRKDVITINLINSYIDNYKNKLIYSGASQRDASLWYNYDIDFQIEQVREWLLCRIEFLDNYFK